MTGMMEWVLSASVLIILVIIIRKLLKGKISCWVRYGLWLLVAVRLLVPVSLMESAFSIANLLPESRAGGQTGGNSTMASRRTDQEQGRIFRQEEMPDSPAPGMAMLTAPYLVEDEHPSKGGVSYAEEKADALSGSDVRDKTALSKIEITIGMVWLAGSCLLALWLSGVNGIFRWKVRGNRLPLWVSGDLQRQLPVYVTDEISTPCMYGLLRPAVYITARTAKDAQVLDMVLRHEQTHYRHGDHIWSVVRMLCLCLHWYNPLVWAAVRLSRQDGELACDEGVLRQMGEENRRIYGEALLILSTEHKPTLRSSLNLATSMSGTKKQLKERLSVLVTRPRMAAGTAVLVFLLALGLMACTFTGRAEAHEEEPIPEKADIVKATQRGGVEIGGGKESDDGQETGPEGEKESDDGQETGPEGEKESDDGQETGPGGEKESDDGQETGPEGEKESDDRQETGSEIVNIDPVEAAAIYDNWDAQIREYYDADENPVAEVTEGDVTRKLTFVETYWSVSAAEAQFSHEVLYWACQALLELEQWTGTQVTEVCYTVSEFGDFSFGLTPEDMMHDRTFYSRCYNGLSFIWGEVIESIYYSTDMDVWYSPVKQYTTPPGYDKMTTEERLIWFFERSAIARGSKVEEVIYPWEGSDYLFRTDQGTYYDFAATEGIDTLGKGLYLAGPYDGYPQH